MFKKFLHEACMEGASDVHFSTGLPPLFRVDGTLVRKEAPVFLDEDLQHAVQTVLDERGIDRLTREGQIDTAYELNGVGRFRINIFKHRGELSMACRIIPATPPTITQLQLPSILKQLARRTEGLVLITGPTGSGKSTTLAALITEINQHMAKHIVTLEDPIEYLHSSQRSLIHQREVGEDTESFSQGLRAALRQDPDVILVGEMRDLETIRTALTAAETGHLVLATLHTPDAPQSIDRIIDVFPAAQQDHIRLQLAAVLACVLAQRLLPRANGRGRVACFEILLNTPAVANLIRTSKVHQIRSVMETGRASGMQSMEQAENDLIAQGLISGKSSSPVEQ